MSQLPDYSAHTDESAWLYMTGPAREPELVDAMTKLCHAAGWALYHPEGEAAEARQRLEALRHADAVIANLFADDAQTLSDLLAARSAGRPILALEPAHQRTTTQARQLLSGYERVVVLACADARECLARAAQTLTEESWRALVRDALSTAYG